ncbi:hypothetical protein BGZ76_000390 [Entomortierella beljakovae]|nr:hypothetical protein BGZ76_000390 [Entomortierella beljakovae]
MNSQMDGMNTVQTPTETTESTQNTTHNDQHDLSSSTSSQRVILPQSPSRTTQRSSYSPPPSPPPPAIRIHNPHTILSSQYEYISPEPGFMNNPDNNNNNHNNNSNNVDEKWVPVLPTEPMPFSPFHIERLQNEKYAGLADHTSSTSSSPTFRPIQPSIAPQLSSYLQPDPLPPPNQFPSQNSTPRKENAADNLEIQSQRHDHRQHHTSNSSGNSRSGASDLTEVTPRKQRDNNNSNNRRKRNSDPSTRRERTSESTVTATWESGKAGSSSTHSTTSHSRPSTRSIGSSVTENNLDKSKACEPLPPPPSQNRFSVFRRKLDSSTNKNARQREKEGRGQSISWAYEGYGGGHQHARNNMTRNIPLGRGYGQEAGGYRRTGIPGRDGEEPETDLFNFINIIVGMPYNPKIKQVVTKLLKILAFMTVSYFLLMALYFAAEFRTVNYLQNISILVVDLDRSMIGNQFLNFTQQDREDNNQINWSIQSKYKDIDSVIRDVSDGNYWGAVVVRPNASVMLNKALSTPLPDYDPRKAFLFIYDGGRNPLAVKPYVVASMYTQFLQFTKFFNPAWITFVLAYAESYNTTLTPLSTAPQVLGTPVAFEELDIHPPVGSIITSATSVAYIWIFLVAGASTYIVAHVVQPVTRFASVRRTMAFLILPLFVFLCSLSMTYTVLLRIFGVPFESPSQFMSLFSAMLLLQSAVASLVLFLIFLIPVTLIPMITITFVVMNVIAVFNPVELMPGFYRWVYAMPFLNAVQMARYILMGSYNRLSYNIPILFAWILVPITLLPFAIARQKRLMAEVIELELNERRQQRQHGYPLDKELGNPQFIDEDDEHYSQFTHDVKTTKRVNRPTEKERQRSSKSRRHHRGNHDDSDNQQSESDDSDENLRRRTHDRRRRRRRRHHRHRPKDDDNEYTDSDDDSYDDGGHRAATNTARLIRPLNPRSISTGVEPSAPPESQVFDTHGRPLIEMLNLSRHPYASELLRPNTPDEVKE